LLTVRAKKHGGRKEFLRPCGKLIQYFQSINYTKRWKCGGVKCGNCAAWLMCKIL
jgi:hypothetical protein